MRSLLLRVAMAEIACLSLCGTVGWAQVPSSPGGANLNDCERLLSAGEFGEALPSCRKAYEADPSSALACRLLARAEYEGGDPSRAAQLWSGLIQKEGWRFESGQGLAMTLWRQGDVKGAEAALRDNLARQPSLPAYQDLIRFFESYGRWQEMAALCGDAALRFPKECSLLEQRARAEASLGRDAEAAGFIREAVAKGCPPFRWAGEGPMSERLSLPAYRSLLAPAALLHGLAESSDAECRLRLKLLDIVPAADAADAAASMALTRKDFEIRLRALSLLEDLGSSALPAWRRVMGSEDFVLRKYALRTIRGMHDPAFIPLLEEEVGREQAPGNRHLAELALGELLMEGKDMGRAEALLTAIPDSDPLFYAATLDLAGIAERRGDFSRALSLLEGLQKSGKYVVSQEQLDRLKGSASRKPSQAIQRTP